MKNCRPDSECYLVVAVICELPELTPSGIQLLNIKVDLKKPSMFTGRNEGMSHSHGISVNLSAEKPTTSIPGSKGDSSITCYCNGLTGVLYAPYGKVTFNGGYFKGFVTARDGFFVTNGGTTVTFEGIDNFMPLIIRLCQMKMMVKKGYLGINLESISTIRQLSDFTSTPSK